MLSKVHSLGLAGIAELDARCGRIVELLQAPYA